MESTSEANVIDPWLEPKANIARHDKIWVLLGQCNVNVILLASRIILGGVSCGPNVGSSQMKAQT